MRTRSRDHSGAELLRLVAQQEECFFCGGRLVICETQERHVQTLAKLFHVIGKGKKCASPGCGHGALRYRSSEVGRLVLKAHEFGRDIVLWAGDQHVRENVSIARVHRRLVEDSGYRFASVASATWSTTTWLCASAWRGTRGGCARG